MAAPTFICIRVSPAKAAINSDWAIAEKVTGAWLLCQESSALQCPAQLNYRLRTEFRLQNIGNFRDLRKTTSLIVPVPIGLCAARRDWNETSPPTTILASGRRRCRA